MKPKPWYYVATQGMPAQGSMTTQEPVRGIAARIAALFAGRLWSRRDSGPIADVESLSVFVRTRAFFVAQHKLYGYVKTRMGMNYPRMFKDDVFIESLNIAKLHVIAACLADASIWAAGEIFPGADGDAAARDSLAARCFQEGISAMAAQDATAELRATWLAAFRQRLAATDWELDGDKHFSESPKALVRFAPIADELKRLDAEIVRNSMKFAWVEVRAEFSKRVAPKEILDDWKSRHSAAPET